ncbi:MAG: hypothetical protein QNJ54_01670 [Prochloraceae cyanobacterium]|nr:hypothetical protein [Prochloraceae cyanobacterium]
MALEKKKNRKALGDNPLSQSIFSKTESTKPVESTDNQDSIKNNQDSIVNNQDSRFLQRDERESVNLRLPLELNDWLNDLLKKGKRRHGAKIPKEIWVQAALEIFQILPVDWEQVTDVDDLREILNNLESSFKNIDYSNNSPEEGD